MEIPGEKSNQKICRRGVHILDRSHFGKESRSKDGLASACRSCIAKKNKAVYQTRKHNKTVALENALE